MGGLGIGERVPWDDFPAVIRNGDRGTLKNEPEYAAANPAIRSPLLTWLAGDIVIKQKMPDDINNKRGPLTNQFWRETFYYGIDKLTQSEAGHLRRAASVDEIRDRLVKARHERIERLGKEGIGSSLCSERGESAKQKEVSSALEQDYRETLSSYTLAKYEQLDRIEDRLEHLIDRQQSRLRQRRIAQPGFVCLPRARHGRPGKRGNRPD